MPIIFVPSRQEILICDFDLTGHVPPEIRKTRRVVVVSPRSQNHRHGRNYGRCIVVPFSQTEPPKLSPADVYFRPGSYESLDGETWCTCGIVMAVSHARLNRVSKGGKFLTEKVSDGDMARIEAGLRSSLGMPRDADP